MILSEGWGREMWPTKYGIEIPQAKREIKKERLIPRGRDMADQLSQFEILRWNEKLKSWDFFINCPERRERLKFRYYIIRFQTFTFHELIELSLVFPYFASLYGIDRPISVAQSLASLHVIALPIYDSEFVDWFILLCLSLRLRKLLDQLWTN